MKLEVIVGVYDEMILMLKITLLLLLKLSKGGAVLEQGLHLNFRNYH
jgi:hypothetical protein